MHFYVIYAKWGVRYAITMKIYPLVLENDLRHISQYAGDLQNLLFIKTIAIKGGPNTLLIY